MSLKIFYVLSWVIHISNLTYPKVSSLIVNLYNVRFCGRGDTPFEAIYSKMGLFYGQNNTFDKTSIELSGSLLLESISPTSIE